jgi:hypothetical protein
LRQLDTFVNWQARAFRRVYADLWKFEREILEFLLMQGERATSAGASRPTEDLMREVLALVPRVELRCPGREGSIVAGFARDGRLSIYFDGDPYYQFDPAGRLRRAFVGGRLFRTEGAGLAALTRIKGDATELRRHDLDSAEFEAFCRAMLEQLRTLREALADGRMEVVDQVPLGAPIIDRLVAGLDSVLAAKGELAPAINKAR